MAPKLKLTMKKSDTEGAKQRAKAAEEKKKVATESMDDAWGRIFALKNSDSDKKKLQEVYHGMESGAIGREPGAQGKRFSKAEAIRLYKQLQVTRREERLNEMVDSLTGNYWLITDKEKLSEFLSIVDNETEIVFDVETTGTNVWSDYIVGHVITAINADIHAYIPTKHKTQQKQLDHDYVNEKLRPYYENERIGKLAHNSKFDIHMLDREGIKLRGLTWDTQEAMRMLNENEPSFALKTLVTKYLRIQSETYGELFGNKTGFDEVSDLKVALSYAAKDGDVTRKLRDFQREYLKKMPEVLKYFESVEVPLISTIVEMEKTGYDIDLDFADKYGKEMKAEIDRLYAELLEELGDININSPAQLKPALEAVTGEKLSSTDAKKVLKPLAKKHEVIEKLLTYKEKFKLYSTYINALPELIDDKTGKLYTNFNQNGAKTGRFSSGGSGVNLQNQPKEARNLFVAPPGYVILGGDWSQQEYRALAYFSQEPKLVQNYLDGKDLYSSIASEVFNKSIEDCGDGSIYRKQTKVILLAVAYGGGANMLKDAIGVSKKKAQEFLDSFFERFPVVAKWIEKNQKFVQKYGYVWMDRELRKRRLPHAKDRKSDLWYTSVFTQSTNAIIQGSAAIQTKVTLNELQRLCERKTTEGNGEWRLWCCVHDEALVLVPDTITRNDVSDFEKVMLESYVFGNVPNKTDIEISRRWGEGKTVEEWFNDNDTKI